MTRKNDSASSGKKSSPIRALKNLSPKQLRARIKKLHRSAVLAGVLTVILVVAGIISFGFRNDSGTQQNNDEEIADLETAPTMPASLTISDGVVEYRTDGIWNTAPDELEITPGMNLKTTGANARAAVTLADGSIIRLDASTEVQFETLTETRVVILQEDGHVYNRVSESDTRTYIVRADNSLFQVQGTAFRTNTVGDEESAEVFQGSIIETGTNLRAGEGKKLTVKNFVNSDRNETIEDIDIETLKQDPFISWNREQDSANEKYQDLLGFLQDFDGPDITITSPEPNSTLEIPSGASNYEIKIAGSTEAGATLTAQSKSQSGSTVVNVEVDDVGNFTTQPLGAPLGNSVFEFIATDKTGNKTTLNVSFIIQEEVVVQKQGIALSKKSDSVPSFTWGLVGITTPDGVQLVYSTSKDPAYGSAKNKYVKSGTNSASIKSSDLTSGKTYYFRVCRYNSDDKKCDTYSNEVSVKIK